MFSRHVMNASSPEKEANFLFRLKKKIKFALSWPRPEHFPQCAYWKEKSLPRGSALEAALLPNCKSVLGPHPCYSPAPQGEHRAQTSSWSLTNYLKETILWRGVYFFSWLKEIQAILPKKHEHWPFFPCQWDLAGGAEWMGFLKLSR